MQAEKNLRQMEGFMQVTIDHRGGWYRWKITIGTGRGSTFAEGKSGSLDGARDIAYAVIAVYCRDDNAGINHIPQSKMMWARVEWSETQSARTQAGRDAELHLKAIFAAQDARRSKAGKARSEKTGEAK